MALGDAPTHSLSQSATLYLASYASTYANARSGTGAVISDWGWVGQYFSGQYEVNQVMVAFDTTVLPSEIAAASLVLTVEESYGNTTVEVREHDWPENASAFVPGAQLASKRLVGNAQVGPGGQRIVTIPLSAVSRQTPFKVVLTIADQTNNIAPTGDTTLLVTSARLDVTVASSRRIRVFSWL